MMYAVSVQVITHDGDYSGSKSVPTFYLDSTVQGITGPEHAADVARDVVNPLGTIAPEDLNIRAYAVPGEAMSGEFDVNGRPIPRSAFAGNVGHVGIPGMPSIEARQAEILRAEPYLAGETVLMRALAAEHADMSARYPDHAHWCAGSSAHMRE